MNDEQTRARQSAAPRRLRKRASSRIPPQSQDHESQSLIANELLLLELIRDIPSLLEVLFPVLRPRAPEIIDETRFARDEFGRPAVGPVDDRALHAALDEVEPPLRIAERRAKLPGSHRVQRTRERLWIVEGGVYRDPLTVGARRERLDRFHTVAEFEHRV